MAMCTFSTKINKLTGSQFGGMFTNTVYPPKSSFNSSCVLFAVSSGVVPPDVIPDDYVGIGISKEVSGLASKFDPFVGTLATVPSKSDPKYASVVESNNNLIWDYAAKQASDKLIGKVDGFTGDKNKLFDQSKYQKGAKSNPYTNALKNCKSVFSRGSWKIFWEAIGIRAQASRELFQQTDVNLKITPEEWLEIKENAVYIGKGFAYSAKTTQSANYIKNFSVAQKKEDIAAFNTWYKDKTHPLIYILRLNVSDIPLGFAVDEIQAFEADPNDKSNVTNIKNKLRALQLDLIAAYRVAKQAGTAYSVADALAKK